MHLVIHLSDAPGSERSHLAFRFGLVALAEHRDVTLVLSAGAVAIAAAPAGITSSSDHGSLDAMVTRFVDNGGRLGVLGASAQEHGLSASDLLDGAAIVSLGWVADEVATASGTLTF